MDLKDRKRKYSSVKTRFLKPAIINFIETEFPSLGGQKVRDLFVDELMKILDECYFPVDKLKFGQMRWLTLSKDTRITSKSPKFVPVTLSLVTEGDIEKYCSGVKRRDIMSDIVARLLNEAYEQGGLLSMRDLSLVMSYDHSYISALRLDYEKRNNTVLHFVGYDHDVGTATSHKTSILRKIFVEKKDPVQVARETEHDPKAVENYCVDLNRVRWCLDKGVSIDEMTIVTGMRKHLIEEYINIIQIENLNPS